MSYGVAMMSISRKLIMLFWSLTWFDYINLCSIDVFLGNKFQFSWQDLVAFCGLITVSEALTRTLHDGGLFTHTYRVDSRLVPSQWETSLLCKAVSHWLGVNLESALYKDPGWSSGHYKASHGSLLSCLFLDLLWVFSPRLLAVIWEMFHTKNWKMSQQEWVITLCIK